MWKLCLALNLLQRLDYFLERKAAFTNFLLPFFAERWNCRLYSKDRCFCRVLLGVRIPSRGFEREKYSRSSLTHSQKSFARCCTACGRRSAVNYVLQWWRCVTDAQSASVDVLTIHDARIYSTASNKSPKEPEIYKPNRKCRDLRQELNDNGVNWQASPHNEAVVPENWRHYY